MNPYLLAGLAAVAFFVLRGGGTAAVTTAPSTGGKSDEEGPRGPTMTANPLAPDGTVIALPAETDSGAVEAALARLREIDEKRRAETAERRTEQTTSLSGMTAGATVKRFAVSGSSTRSMTDFGV
jgi:hypothetical protein